ncbi:MAG TPA: calcium-binding protein [Allosphingosinicella sp.]|jgi:Ca2+-binding RTX toxin-like protein
MAWIKGSWYSEDLYGTSYDDLIEGFEGDDGLYGRGGDDELYGDSGNDDLDGGSGWDYMEGGTGDDLYVVDSTGDEVVEFAGEGRDVVLTWLNSYTLGANVEDLAALGSSDFYGTGNGLNNEIHGYDGDDVLDGAGGNDLLVGELGDDTYSVDQTGDAVVEYAGEGIDLVFTSLSSFTLPANVEELIYDGTGSFKGTGNGLNNYLEGAGGADRLDGRAGADEMVGGLGSDTYVVDNSGDKVRETSASGGTDTVESSISYTLGSNVENLKLMGTANLNGTGNGLSNAITGNSGANKLLGLGGNDTIDAGAGNDRIVGGAGNDSIRGGTGADGFYFDSPLSSSSNVDRMLDFSSADDTVFLNRNVFTGFAANGTISASAFHTGTAAHDADDRIIYDSATGKIFYDADGTGAGAAVLFAQVNSGTAVSYTDFSVYTPA